MDEQEYHRNEAAYRRMKETIRQSYPKGTFVAISGEQILTDAATFPEMLDRIRARGLDPRNVLVIEAGIDYPESAIVSFGLSLWAVPQPTGK